MKDIHFTPPCKILGPPVRIPVKKSKLVSATSSHKTYTPKPRLAQERFKPRFRALGLGFLNHRNTTKNAQPAS